MIYKIPLINERQNIRYVMLHSSITLHTDEYVRTVGV